eukprot:scaffold10057_cov140-Isochrysis_galbana.AAC.3
MRLQEADRRDAEDGTRTDNVAKRGAGEQPGNAKRLHHLIVRGALDETLALDGHGRDDEDIGHNHDNGLRATGSG